MFRAARNTAAALNLLRSFVNRSDEWLAGARFVTREEKGVSGLRRRDKKEEEGGRRRSEGGEEVSGRKGGEVAEWVCGEEIRKEGKG